MSSRSKSKLIAQREVLEAVVARAWAAISVDPFEAADDPDTADLADAIRVSLQYERDRAKMRRRSRRRTAPRCERSTRMMPASTATTR